MKEKAIFFQTYLVKVTFWFIHFLLIEELKRVFVWEGESRLRELNSVYIKISLQLEIHIHHHVCYIVNAIWHLNTVNILWC